MAMILIVEDDSAIAELLAVNLKHAGFQSKWVQNTIDAQIEIDARIPDLILLDWMLPGRSGVDFVKYLRVGQRTAPIPIIMVTAKHEEFNLIDALEAGADDYIVKPFSVKEILARVKALLRRKKPELVSQQTEYSGLSLDLNSLQVKYKNKTVKLSPIDAKLLNHLLNNINRTYSRSSILDIIWGDHVFIEERTVDVHIKRLRKNLKQIQAEHFIETVRGLGYKVNPDHNRSNS